MIIVTVTLQIYNRSKNTCYTVISYSTVLPQKSCPNKHSSTEALAYVLDDTPRIDVHMYHIVFAPSYWVWTMNIYSKVVRVLLVPYKAFSCGVLHRFYNMGRFLDRNSGCFKILTAQCITAKRIFSMLISFKS